LAYAFCKLVFRTPVTPNGVTLFAIALGLVAAACWFEGSRTAMIWGGALLWISAIMDGADGILARAKNMQSAFGRALDGSADMVVGLSTSAACLWHLVANGADMAFLALGLVAVLLTGLHLNLYDFYKELHLRQTRLERGGEGDDAERAAQLKAQAVSERAPWYTRLSMTFYADYNVFQENLIRRTNPLALRLLRGVARSPASADLYREVNRSPMRMWMAVSLAPHSYLFAIFGMADRLDLYLWLRLTLMNLLCLLGLALQKKATTRTVEAYRAHGWIEDPVA
ncbi:MAG TPA: CDP-alcohol phosphatidyltransferase family protein, partial [Polyangiales bacterium]